MAPLAAEHLCQRRGGEEDSPVRLVAKTALLFVHLIAYALFGQACKQYQWRRERMLVNPPQWSEV